MAKRDTLRVAISPALRKELGLTGDEAEVDYFTLLGLERGVVNAEKANDAVLELSAKLRQWQTSPQYGQETVGLLRTVQRAGKILADERRCKAYLSELRRSETGRTRSAIDEFTDLVRAAIGDGVISQQARNDLNLYAQQRGLTAADAQRIIVRTRDEIRRQREAEVEPGAVAAAKEDWEFHLAEEGEESFFFEMQGIEHSGKFAPETTGYLMSQASKYGLTADRAARLIAEFQRVRFRNTVERVAGRGAISDGQAKMLLSKASNYGLNNKQAYEIISDYTLSAYDTEEMLQVLAASTFSQGDIETIVSGDNASKLSKPKKVSTGPMLPPDTLKNVVLAAVVIAVLVAAGTWGRQWIEGRRDRADARRAQADAPAATPRPTAAPGQPAPPPRPTAQPDPAATQTPAPAAGRKLVTLPDPPSGMIGFEPAAEDDPPYFEIAITEVTNLQYQAFLRSTLEQAPPDWGENYAFPAGRAMHPVTNVDWRMANEYCLWLQRELNLPVGSVSLPTHEQYLRALRGGPTLRGDPAADNYWSRARLGRANAAKAARATNWDKIFVEGKGQLYDLVGNVSEWGADDLAGERIVLGGDFNQDASDFDPKDRRWLPPETRDPAIGFRYVYLPRR